MSVPFFRVENELVVFSKLKLLSYAYKIRNLDFLLLFFVVLPVAINLLYYIVIKGSNNPLCLFMPFTALFYKATDFDISQWIKPFGVVNFLFIIAIISLRIWVARLLYLKILDFEKNNHKFKWPQGSKIKKMILVPFFSFYVYPSIAQLANFEVIHQYNL